MTDQKRDPNQLISQGSSSRSPRDLSGYNLPIPLTIQAVCDENYRTRTLTLNGSVDAYPGQFVMVWLPRFDEKPFSLVNADPITLMVTAVGPASRLLYEMTVGDVIRVRGAYGHGFQIGPSQRRLALVGGGYGVAPLHWLARTQIGRADHITAIIGARQAQDILYAQRFRRTMEEAEETKTHMDLFITTEDGAEGRRGIVTDVLDELLEAGKIDAIYACGPHGMLEALESLGATYDVTTQLSWESYMRCAVGICGACEHHGKLLCLDGPVLTRQGGEEIGD